MESSSNDKVTPQLVVEDTYENFKSYAEPILKMVEKELYKLYESNVKLKVKNKQLKKKLSKLQKRPSIDLDTLRTSIFKRRSLSASQKTPTTVQTDDVVPVNESYGESNGGNVAGAACENPDLKCTGSLRTVRKHRSIANRLGLDNKSQHTEVNMFSSLKLHNDIVWNVTTDLFQNNTYLLFTCSADSTCKISLMDRSECIEPVLSYRGHSGSVNSMSFNLKTPGLMCTGSGDGSVHLWTYRNLYDTMVGDEDNTTITSGHFNDVHPSESSGIKHIDSPLISMKAHDLPVSTVEWNRNGVDLLSASWDAKIKIWDSDKQVCVKTLDGHSGEVTTAHYGTAESIVISGSADKTIRVWDIRAPEPSIEICHAHNNVVTSAISLHYNENLIVSSGKDKTVKVWDRRKLTQQVYSRKFGSPVNKISLSSKDSMICVPEDNGHIWLCNTKLERSIQLCSEVSKKRQKTSVLCGDWMDHSSSINCCDEENNSRAVASLISADHSGTVNCWKVNLSKLPK